MNTSSIAMLGVSNASNGTDDGLSTAKAQRLPDYGYMPYANESIAIDILCIDNCN
jgi:hypothetical protein